MPELEGLFAIAIAFFIVAASPGPATLACATVSMQCGRKCGLRFGFGLSLGLMFWGCVAATGLGAVLQGSAHLLTLLKIIGGLYLLWLAFGSATSALRPDTPLTGVIEDGRWFTRGLLLNLSNPKAVVAWMAALSLGMTNGQGFVEVASATLICSLLGVLCYTVYALAFSMDGIMRGYQRIRRWVDGAVAGFFAVAGLGLIRSALSR